ncbi:MAG: SBBP repeat-containing protein [Bryobacteraceae bacterium]
MTPVCASTPGPFSTFLKEDLSLLGAGHDAAGNIFVLGQVLNSGLPGGFVSIADIAAARLDPNATQVAYFVDLTGTGGCEPVALAVDPPGNAYITGYCNGGTLPATFGFGGPILSGSNYPFAIKLDPTGAVVYEVLFAGQVFAIPTDIAVDGGGNAIITGSATQGYPVTPGAISFSRGNVTQFVTKLDASGAHILFSAVGVGGYHIALGPQGDIFVTGPYGPTTPGAYQTTSTQSCNYPYCVNDPSQNVTRLSSDGPTLIYGTFLTGSNGAQNDGLAVDSAGNAYVTGTTISEDYPYTTASAPGDRPGTFVTKLDPTGSQVLWSVPQGGGTLALDAAGNPVVSGTASVTISPNQPVYLPYPPPPSSGNTPAPCYPNGGTIQSTAYVQRFNAADGGMTGSVFLTGTQLYGGAITAEPDGRIAMAGYTSLPDVPLSPGVVFSDAIAQRTVLGAYLAAFDLSEPGQLGCVLDGGSLSPVGPVAPGQLISLFGNGLGPAAGVSGFVAGQSSLPTSLAGVQVAFDGIPAPLLYVSSGQVNVQVPFEVAQEPSTVMTVSVNSNPVATQMFVVTASNPSVFIDTAGSIAGCGQDFLPNSPPMVALNSDGSRNSCANPALSGSMVTVFLNGLAATVEGAFPATGSITGSNPAPLTTQAQIGGEQVPLYPVPGTIAGVYQLVFQVTTLLPPQQTSLAAGLLVSVNGLFAGPFYADQFVLYEAPYPLGTFIWVKP